MNDHRIFFSHRTHDRAKVEELQRHLKERLPNFPFEDASTRVPFVDDWKKSATSILETCDALVCCVSENTHASEPIDWELREANRLATPIVVVTLLKPCQLPSACDELKLHTMQWDTDRVAQRISDILLPRALFAGHDWTQGPPDSKLLFDQYGIMVQSWESLIERRQSVNTLYMSTHTAILAGVGVLISSFDKLGAVWVAAGIAALSLLGGGLSLNWYRTIVSYGTLSSAKSKVVATLEKFLPARLFDFEWRVLETKKYKSTTETETNTAKFFFWLYVAMFLIAAGVAIAKSVA